jgi:DNA invertase Pin-like site-specific DNA recombinase
MLPWNWLGKRMRFDQLKRRQGKSGLGIEAQRQAVATYLNGGNWRISAEFTEIESGKRSDRPALDKALAAARGSGAARRRQG